MTEWIILGIMAVSLILSIISLAMISKNKNVTTLDDRDKKELTSSFSQNVGVISSALEKSNDKSAENVAIRLDSMNVKIEERNKAIEMRLEAMERSQAEKLEAVRQTLERNVAAMQKSNEQKLSEIKQTVDEKLTETLNDRFKESFKFLSEQLERVSKTVGEMQNISKDVGNLTKVLSNV